ncbi:MAG: ATP-binding protein [Thermoprotei archaeon]
MALASVTRSLTQVVINIVVTYLTLNMLFIVGGTTDITITGVYSGIFALLILSVFTIISMIILQSLVLSLINTVIILFAIWRVEHFISMESLLIFYTILVVIIPTYIISRVIGLHDHFVEALRAVPSKPYRIDIILSCLTLYFATLALSYPVTYILMNYTGFSRRISTDIYLLFSIPLALALILVSKSRTSALYLGLLTPFTLFSIVPMISHTFTEKMLAELSVDVLAPAPSRGIYLGRLLAKIAYGIPHRLYEGVEQDWLKRKRGRTWYWTSLNKKPLYINPEKLPNKHIVIVGSSGSGKSLLAKHILLEYYSKFNTKFLVFDPHNEYKVLSKNIPELQVIDASKLSLNPLELGRLGPRERAHQFSNIVMSLFRLGHLQRQAIEEITLETYKLFGIYPDAPSTWNNKPPTIHDVLGLCRNLMQENELYRKIYPYLRILADNVFTHTTIRLSKMLSAPTVIALNNLRSDYVRILYVDTFLQKLIDMMYRRELKEPMIIVLDEAYTLLSRDYSRHIASRLLAESRKYGLGLIFISQHPLSIPPPVIENAAIKISFNISEPRNLEYVSKLFSGIYHGERINAIKTALRSLKSLNYVLAITGLSDIYIISEEEIIKEILV